jgi:hypothetical protein
VTLTAKRKTGLSERERAVIGLRMGQVGGSKALLSLLDSSHKSLEVVQEGKV